MKAVRAALIWTDKGFVGDRVVLIEGADISGVVEAAQVPASADVEDWGDVALVPGTVAAHGHSFQSLLKGFADDRPFASWRDDVLYPFSERLDGEAIYTGALFAFAEALLAGVTTTVDFFYLNDGANDNARRVIEAARDIGIRLVLARSFYDPEAPTAAPDRYREPADEAAGACIELAEKYAADPLISVQPAPHSLHAVSPDTIRVALQVAKDLDVPCHLHLAEARYEVEQISERYGATPVRLLAREGLLERRLVTIHSVWLDDQEMDLLARDDVGVVHCPGANAFLGDGIAKLPELLSRNVRLALGPDGGCANNRQSVFDEMRTASLLAKARLLDGGALQARTVFDLGTRGGAELLGLPTGRIANGMRADIVALDLSDLSLYPLETLEHQVVNSMQQTAVERVMVGGEVVVERGDLIKIGGAEIARRVQEVTGNWRRP